MLTIILISAITILFWVFAIIEWKKDETFTAGYFAIIFTFIVGFMVIAAHSMSNPSAKELKDLQDKREVIIYGLENTTNEYLYVSLYEDAQKFNNEKRNYETMKNNVWAGCFQDKRYEYVDYIDLKEGIK